MIRWALVLCLLTYSAISSGSVFDHPASVNDQTLIAASEQLAATEAIHGTFEQRKHVEGLPMPLVSSGEFLFSQGTGVYWQSLTPYPSALLIGPNKLLQKHADENWSPMIGNEGAATMFGSLFLALLSVDIAELEKRFLLYWQANGLQSNRPESSGWLLGLRPKPGPLAKQLTEIVLQGGGHVQSVLMVDRYGDRTEINLQNNGRPNLAEIEAAFSAL